MAFDLHDHRVSERGATLYIPDNDWIEMAKTIAHLMDNPRLCIEMGQYGQSRVKNALTWEHSAQHLIEAYQYLFPQTKLPLNLAPSTENTVS